MHEHSFAKVWLDFLGNKIYINDKNFFAQDLDECKKQFKITALNTYINLGADLVDTEELRKYDTISYGDMKEKYGFVVYRISAQGIAWKSGQKYVYVIAKKTPNMPGEVSDDNLRVRKSTSGIAYVFQWDKKNQQIRGIGPDFGTPQGQYGVGDMTPWIPYGEKKEVPKKYDFSFKPEYNTTDILASLTGNTVSKPIHMPIGKNEVPVMITEDNKLLCLYDSDELPRMIIAGVSGSGKTYSMLALMGRVFYIRQDRVGLINDSQNQFYDTMLQMSDDALLMQLNRIGNAGKYIPAINLYLSCPDLKIKYANEQVGYRLVIAIKEFIRNWEHYTKGIAKLKIDSPQKYLEDEEIVSGLIKCKSKEDVQKFLFAKFTERKGKELDDGTKGMLMKWVAAFDVIFQYQCTSNLFTKEDTTAPYWKLVKKDGEVLVGHPFIISYEAGLVPQINNYLAKDKIRIMAKKHMAKLLYKIKSWQIKRDTKKLPIWIFIDELKDLVDKKNDELYAALDEIYTQGRFQKIGLCVNIQEYSRISKGMRNNATHLIIFDLRAKEERKAVADDYELDKDEVDSISELKQYQCLFTTKRKVVLYDIDGNRDVKERGIFKGTMLPPITSLPQSV
jgi:hypothetical protein